MRASPTPASAFLLAAILLLANGCVSHPLPALAYRSAQFGEDATAEFRVGTNCRAAIFSKFGRPSYSTPHDLACGYLFATKTGTAQGLLMGPCMPYFGSTEIVALDDVWLEFDSTGTLKRVEKRLAKKNHHNPAVAWRKFQATISPAANPPPSP